MTLRFRKLHLIHAFLGVPMQEGLPLENGTELIADTLEELLDGGAVAQEGDGHVHSTRWDVALRGHDVVGNPFDEVVGVLGLHVLHLLLNFLHRDLATEDSDYLGALMMRFGPFDIGKPQDGTYSKIASMTGVTSSHHVLGVKNLLYKFGDGHSPILLASVGGQRGE